jgi:hypothetical protein
MKAINLLSDRIVVLKKEEKRLKFIGNQSFLNYDYLMNDIFEIGFEILELENAIKILNKNL